MKAATIPSFTVLQLITMCPKNNSPWDVACLIDEFCSHLHPTTLILPRSITFSRAPSSAAHGDADNHRASHVTWSLGESPTIRGNMFNLILEGVDRITRVYLQKHRSIAANPAGLPIHTATMCRSSWTPPSSACSAHVHECAEPSKCLQDGGQISEAIVADVALDLVRE